MIPISLRNKAKKLGIRVTKDVDGKRVKLTEKDIKKTIFAVLRNKASNTKKFIRICKNVLVTASPNNNRRVTRSSSQAPPSTSTSTSTSTTRSQKTCNKCEACQTHE